jgi:flagellar M-ring protein FliF
MADAAIALLNQGPAAWRGLGRGHQIVLLAVAVLLPVLLFVGSQWIADGQYVPLFASLTAEDAGAIVSQLKAAKVPYRVGGNGEQILVPADRAAELRLKMAVQGLPLGGGVGFEVFDKTAFGVSDFTQRLNYQRALQGELARTIGQLRAVTRARVHLVLPQPSLFAERDRPASASVFLKLQPGAQLGREEVRGIVHLVASSVEGLSPERVTVVDTAGRVLSTGTDQGGPLSPRRLEAKTSIEEGLERRVQGLLDSALGAGQAVARVAVLLNFDQVERTEEKFSPENVARQKTTSSERNKGKTSTPTTPVGSPEIATADKDGAASVTQNEGSRDSESTTYEISRVINRTTTSPGEIRRLTVAVMLNTPQKVTVPAEGDKKEVREPAPRSAEELEKIRQVVKGAVGFDEKRGDEVTVVEMPFDPTTLERERTALEQAAPAGRPFGGPWLSWAMLGGAGVLVLAGLAAVVIVLRQAGRRRVLELAQLAIDSQTPGGGRPATATGVAASAAASTYSPRAPQPLVPDELMDLSREREDIRQKALAMATTEPEATAQLLRAWLVKKRQIPAVPGGAA